MKNEVLFVSGIDTNIGKSYATGFLAKTWRENGLSVITQKMVQTGNDGYSEDINLHRAIMGVAMCEEDKSCVTMPEIYSYPASPHLAAEIDQRPLNLNKISEATQYLLQRFDTVLLEGAGGLMVPLSRSMTTLDYVAEKEYPVVLVTSGRLGSINHTLLTLEVMKSRGLKLHTLAYNLFPKTDERIENDTKDYLKALLRAEYPEALFVEIPEIKLD